MYASQKAYATVAYWRFENSKNEIHTAFITAKSRVAPLNPQTISRLELQAAVIGCRIAKFIAEEHSFQISKRIFWADSITVLRWIKSDLCEFKVFVMHRLGEINELSKTAEWRWVPSKLSPSDEGTKWAPEALQNGSRWLQGPNFLLDHESVWPKENYAQETSFGELSQRKNNKGSNVNVCTFLQKFDRVFYLPDATRFSSWTRLVASTNCVLKAKEIFLKTSPDLPL